MFAAKYLIEISYSKDTCIPKNNHSNPPAATFGGVTVGATYMGPNPTQYPQMVAQEEIPSGEDVSEGEDPGEDNDSEDKDERNED